MPMIDMPLEKLQTYGGTNPKPEDFDKFWDDSLAELASVDPDIKITPAAFQAPYADCFDLWFTGTRGGRVYAKFLKPKNLEVPVPAIVEFHGLSGSSGDWVDKLPYVAAGFCVASMDCRGQGGKSFDPGGALGNTLSGHLIRGLDDVPEKMYYRNVYLDCARLARIVLDMAEVDSNRVCAKGGSQGGGLTLACAALEPRIRRAMPLFPYLCDYQRVWNMDLDQGAYQCMRDYFRRFDPRHERHDEVFTQLGYIDNQHLAPRIKAEIKMATGLMDTICPPSTQYAAFNKISGTKEVVIYPDFGHEGLPQISDITFQWFCELL
jgi:cephalosporin-C deacetylase